MAPIHLGTRNYASIVSLAPAFLRLVHEYFVNDPHTHRFAKREPKGAERIVFIVLIPVLVLLSGLFAGLTLGYMSLDETQLNVLAISGTPKQQAYAKKIQPIRKNGHLLLVTLLLANMIVNETLPVISDPVLGGGVPSVAVSTVLIVIFSEIIPQSVCTRYGLAIGAKMAPFTHVLLWTFGILAWPVAKLLEFILGPHHGIMYRRSELKELVNMHSAAESHGGDLKRDTVTIIGAALDLEEKTAKDAMTAIEDVFMLPLSAKLDHATLEKVVQTGHSRVPVYDEVEVPIFNDDTEVRKEKVKKIVGILLVKHCVLLDPKDAKPVRDIPLNRVIFVPQNELLLGILDKFQEGRSHIAVVTRFSKEVAASVKQEVKKGFSKRLKDKVGMTDSSESESSDDEDATKHDEKKDSQPYQKPWGSGNEQNMPADAVLPKSGQNEIMRSMEPGVMPLGIITLEDVLEELIGEEIYDEFDAEGEAPDLYHAQFEKKVPKVSGSAPSGQAGATDVARPLPSSRRPSLRMPRPIKAISAMAIKSKSLPPSEQPTPAPADAARSTPNSPNPGSAPAPDRSTSPMPMEVGEHTHEGTETTATTDATASTLKAPAVLTPGFAGAPLGTVLHDRARSRQPSFTRTNPGGSPKLGGKRGLFKSLPIDGATASSSNISRRNVEEKKDEPTDQTSNEKQDDAGS